MAKKIDITRQASLEYAIQYMRLQPVGTCTADEVLNVAVKFEDFLEGKDQEKSA